MLQTLTFSGPRQIDALASFFRYETGAAGGLDESIRIRADGQDLGIYLPGDSVELPQPASRWNIEPLAAGCVGAVRVGLGRVQSSKLSGSIRVVDEITDALTNSYHLPSGAIAPYTALQVVAPAANTRGMIVRNSEASSRAGPGGSADIGFVVARSLPTGYQAPPQRWWLATSYNLNTTLQVVKEKSNKIIPPGWGLYMYTEVAIANSPLLSGVVSYEML